MIGIVLFACFFNVFLHYMNLLNIMDACFSLWYTYNYIKNNQTNKNVISHCSENQMATDKAHSLSIVHEMEIVCILVNIITSQETCYSI